MRTLLLLSSVVVAGLSGCSSLQSGTCGAENQKCCAEATCNTSLACAVDNVCKPCGAQGQQCCPAGAVPCAAGLSCQNNACAAPPSCPTDCMPGAKRCTPGQGIELCINVSATCADWSLVVPQCPGTQSCVQTGADAVCADSCPGACALGSVTCGAAGLKVCLQDPLTLCPTEVEQADNPDQPLCTTGACEANLCWESPLPQGNALHAIAGWDLDQFFVLDELGAIIRNDALAWRYEYHSTDTQLVRSIANCVVPGLMMAAGRGGLVLRRIGGVWTPEVFPDSTASLTSLACDSALRAVAVDANGKLFLRSSGSAGTWTAVPTGTSAQLNSVSLYSFAGEAFAVGNNGTFVRCTGVLNPATASCAVEGPGLSTARLNAVWHDTSSGACWAGDSTGGLYTRLATGWTVSDRSNTSGVNAVSGVGDKAWFGGEGGRFTVWSGVFREDSFTTESLTGLMQASNGVAGLVAVTSSAGVWANTLQADNTPTHGGWKRQGGARPTGVNLWAATGSVPTDLYAVGSAGTVLHRNGDAWLPEAQGLTTEGLLAASWVSAREVYAVGSQGTVLARRGTTWTKEALGLTAATLEAVVSDGHTVFVAGEGGVWAEKPVSAAGTQWALQPQGATTARLNALALRSANGVAAEVYAAGNNCTLLIKSAAGFTVEAVPQCQGDDLLAATVSPGGDLYLGGAQAFLTRRSAGTWTREYLGNTQCNVLALAAQGDVVWAACSEGELYKRTAGSWLPVFSGVTLHDLTGLAPTSIGQLFVVGRFGLIWRRD